MNKIEKSKELAFLLRHDKNYKFIGNGWRAVNDLMVNHSFAPQLLEDIVKTDNKGRYEFNDDHTLIRARQGHSIDVDVELKEATPPAQLYHGTAIKSVPSIKKNGIKPMSRKYVHLSKDVKTAIDVGKRHGDCSVLYIDTDAMAKDGFKFFLSRNGVWMTEYVPYKYVTEVIVDF